MVNGSHRQSIRKRRSKCMAIHRIVFQFPVFQFIEVKNKPINDTAQAELSCTVIGIIDL